MDSIVQTVVSLLNGERAIILVLVGLIGYVMLQKRVDPKKRPDEKDAPPTEEVITGASYSFQHDN
jgi:hypothetical protein